MDESQPIHLPRPHTMSKTKFFCIGTEGATTDGRTIERAHLQQFGDARDAPALPVERAGVFAGL